MIVGAPCMPVARADGEAQPSVELGCGGEIAHRMNDVVEATRHRTPSLHRREGRRLEEHVLDRRNDRSIAFALGALGYPFRIIYELVPLRSEEHTSELQSRPHLVCRLL